RIGAPSRMPILIDGVLHTAFELTPDKRPAKP
ncbi:GNAT family N-acetyltransferase, partial [Rhizobium ruizarguesonis]